MRLLGLSYSKQLNFNQKGLSMFMGLSTHVSTVLLCGLHRVYYGEYFAIGIGCVLQFTMQDCCVTILDLFLATTAKLG
jgi:hypothetical protein